MKTNEFNVEGIVAPYNGTIVVEDVFHTKEGAAVMRYWGRLCGSLFGTIVSVYKLETGDYYIETNHMREDGTFFNDIVRKANL